MSDQDEPKANERDGDSDEGRDSDADIGSEREPAPAASKKVAGKNRTGAPRRATANKAPAKAQGSNVGVFVLLALLAGGAAGYFGHMQQAKAALAKDSAAPAGSGAAAGPCGAWEKKICGSSGEQSAACRQAKGATELLTPSTCEQALTTMPATLSKLKAARASCDKLVSKLCNDLPPGAQTCAMVKEKTPSFPAQQCDEMLKQYDDVLAQLRQMEEQRGGLMGGPGGPGGPGPGGPGMAPPPGMPAH